MVHKETERMNVSPSLEAPLFNEFVPGDLLKVRGISTLRSVRALWLLVAIDVKNDVVITINPHEGVRRSSTYTLLATKKRVQGAETE